MMTSLGAARAMEVFKDLEEKKEQVRLLLEVERSKGSQETTAATFIVLVVDLRYVRRCLVRVSLPKPEVC